MDYGKLALKKIEELYSSLYGQLNKTEVPTVSRISITNPRITGQTSFSRQIRFKTGADGRVSINLLVGLSRTLTVNFLFDGQVVKSSSFTSSTTNGEVVLSGVPAGMHVAEVQMSGSSFTVSNFCLTVTGNLISQDGDIFSEGFSTLDGFISLNLGRLEVYSFSLGVASLVHTYYGISSARVVGGDGNAIVVVTENGRAYVIIGALTSSPRHVFLCDGAVCAGGCCIAEGYADIIVGKSKGAEVFRVLIVGEEVVNCGGIAQGFSSVTAVQSSGRVYLVGESGGYVTLSEAVPKTDYNTLESFSVAVRVEV